MAHFDEILDLKLVGRRQSHVVLASNGPELRVIDMATMSTSTLSGHTDMVLSLDASRDGRFIASGSKVRW